MEQGWADAAARAIAGLGVRAGELVLVRDHTGRADVLQEMLLAIERHGATPLLEIVTAAYLGRLAREAPEAYLSTWDRHRRGWLEQADRVLVLEGEPLGLDLPVSAASVTWQRAAGRLSEIEEARGLPYLLVAVPTERQASRLGQPLADLENVILPALTVEAATLRAEIDRVLAAARGATMTIHSGAGHELHLSLGERPWLDDDGAISDEDRARGGIVSNLPAGSIYTTVLEDQTAGTLHLPRAEDATDVTLHFTAGQVTEIRAATGLESLQALFEGQTGEARRIGHIGVGLNPRLQQPLGWTLVDEHVRGFLFVSLGENRYMGGQNASSLNVDFAVPHASLLIDGRVIVRDGSLDHQVGPGGDLAPPGYRGDL